MNAKDRKNIQKWAQIDKTIAGLAQERGLRVTAQRAQDRADEAVQALTEEDE